MIPLTIKEEIDHNKQKICYICKKEFDKKNYKVRDHFHYTGKYRGPAHNICNLRYKIPKEIPIVFHNGSTYDYHFIIKELVKEFKGNFECKKLVCNLRNKKTRCTYKIIKTSIKSWIKIKKSSKNY